MMRFISCLAFLVLTSAVSAEPFRCNLDEIAEPMPPLLLIGEQHYVRDSNVLKTSGARYACAGTLIIGLEGIFPSEIDKGCELFGQKFSEASRAFGIESPFPYGLTSTYLAADPDRYRGEWISGLAMAEIADGLARNEYLAYSWDQVKKEQNGFQGSPLKPYAELIDRAAADPHKRVRIALDDVEPMAKILAMINKVYVDLGNDRYLTAMGLDKPLRAVGQSGANESFQAAILDIRNRDMARNLEDLYCGYAKHEHKPVIAVVGAAHLPGMRKILEDAAKPFSHRLPLKAMHPLMAADLRKTPGFDPADLKELEGMYVFVETIYSAIEELSQWGRQAAAPQLPEASKLTAPISQFGVETQRQ